MTPAPSSRRLLLVSPANRWRCEHRQERSAMTPASAERRAGAGQPASIGRATPWVREGELAAQRELKPVADVVRAREHARAREFHLPDREAIAVAALAILSRQRRGQPGLPVRPEPLDVAPTEGGADPRQRVGVLDRAKPVIQRLEADPAL